MTYLHALSGSSRPSGGPRHRIVPGVPRPLALEARFMFDGAAAAEAVDAVVEHSDHCDEGLPPLTSPRITQAYAIHTEETPGTRNQNSHAFTNDAITVKSIEVDTDPGDGFGNDILASITLALDGKDTTFFGWISRQIKDGSETQGLYFWTDKSFTSEQAALDGYKDQSKDPDENNHAFILALGTTWEGAAGRSFTEKSSSDIKTKDWETDACEEPENRAPTASNDTATTNEDTTLFLTLNDFGTFSDIDGDALTKIQITTLENNGSLEYRTGSTWGAVTLNQQINATDIAAGKLRFVPDLNENGSPYATIGFKVSDGTAYSASAYTLTMNVTAVNDAPTASNDSATTREDTARLLRLNDFGTFADVDGNTLSKIQITTLENNGSLEYRTGSTWGAVTLNQQINATDIAAGKLRFVPDLNENGSPYATIGFKVSDGTAYSASAYTLTMNVTAVNDSPTASNDSATTLEDTPHVLTLNDFGTFADVDGDTLVKIKITKLENNGSLECLTGSTWGAVTLNQQINATDIAAGKLRFVPDLNENGSPYTTIGFKVSDGTAYSTSAYTLTMNVTAVNDVPVTSDLTVSVLEDGTHRFSASNFGFNDPSDTPAHTLASVIITSLPLAGTLAYDGVAIALNDGSFKVAATDIDNLTFTPAPNAHGISYASFFFQVQDNGGTSNGGVDTSETKRMTVSVTSVNDRPEAKSTTITISEDETHTFSASDFGFSDPNDFNESDNPFYPSAHTLAYVIITSLPQEGTLAYDDAPITLIDGNFKIASYDINRLTFSPAANASGDVYAKFGFQVQDNGGTSNGGVDTSETRSITVAVTPVNDAPTSTDDAATTNETTALVLSANDFGTFADIDDDSLQAVQITQGPTTGTLGRWNSNGWRALFPGETVFSVSDLTSGSLGFIPGTTDTSLQFQVSDGTDWSAATYTLTLNVMRTVSPVPTPDPVPTPPPASAPAVQATVVPVPPSESASGPLIPPPSAQPIVLEPPAGLRIPQVFDSALYPQRASMSMAATYMIEQFDGQPARLVRDMALWVVDDSYTEAPANQWRVAVHPDIRSEITVWRGVRDHVIESYDVAYLSIPWDSFSHTHSDAQVTLEATLTDGNPLPPWMNLDSRFGVFELVPPPQFQGELAIRLMARDTEGRVAATVFRIQVRERGLALGDGAIPIGRASLNEQLRDATRQRTSSAPSFPSNPS